ncbi:hypothetical protein V5O48_011337 [Marasmius crinis-equi]|uniref:Ubiquitin-like protease family profile domain-containing protein n=1 Tax=Marasmius crinis-equi TaxID=585013 RepID=A0ABR3F5W4_9AGAR
MKSVQNRKQNRKTRDEETGNVKTKPKPKPKPRSRAIWNAPPLEFGDIQETQGSTSRQELARIDTPTIDSQPGVVFEMMQQQFTFDQTIGRGLRESQSFSILQFLPGRLDPMLSFVDWSKWPWNTDVFCQGTLEEKVHNVPIEFQQLMFEMHKPVLALLLEDLLSRWSRMEANSLSKVFFDENHAKKRDKSTMPISKGVWCLRLLEKLTILDANSTFTPHPVQQPRTRFHKLKTFTGLKDLSNWRGTLVSLKDAIESSSFGSYVSSPPARGNKEDGVWDLECLVWQAQAYEQDVENAHVASVLANISSVALFIRNLKMGNLDLPTNFEAYILEKARDYPEILARVKSNPLKKIRQNDILGCVFVACATSSLILCGTKHMTDTNLPRGDLLQLWLHLGNMFPPAVAALDLAFWRCIKRVADGEMGSLDSLKMFLREDVDLNVLQTLPPEETLFFSPSFGIPFDEYRTTLTPSQQEQPLFAYIEELEENRYNVPIEDEEEEIEEQPMPGNAAAQGNYANGENAAVGHEHPGGGIDPKLLEGDKATVEDYDDEGHEQEHEAPQEEEEEEDEEEGEEEGEGEEDDDDADDEVKNDILDTIQSPVRRRKRKAIKATNPKPEKTTKRKKNAITATIKTTKTNTIKEKHTATKEKQATTNRKKEKPVVSKETGMQNLELGGPLPSTTYELGEIKLLPFTGTPVTAEPWFYTMAHAQQMASIFERADETTDFMALPSSSRQTSVSKPHPAIAVITRDEYESTSRAGMQHLFASHHILIHGCTVAEEDQRWTEDVLSKVGNMDEKREIHDLSLSGKVKTPNEQIRMGTFRDVLNEGLKPMGKPINCLDIPSLPMLEGFRATKLFTNGRIAIHKVKGAKIFDSKAFDMDAHCWHLLATKGSSHPAHIDTAGYATMVAPQTGVKIFFLLVPGQDNPSFEEANGALEFAELGHDMTNEVGMVVLPVLLRPGDVLLMRPCTPHYVLTLDNSLCHGSHFYCASTISDTCFGIYHTFTHQSSITNQDDIAHRISLARTICFWHDRVTSMQGYFSRPAGTFVVDDIPTFRSMSGIMDFLCLYNLIQMGSLIWKERYSEGKVDETLVEMYELAKERGEAILAWLNAAIVIHRVHMEKGATQDYKFHDEDLTSPQSRLLEIRDEFLAHQCASLHAAIEANPQCDVQADDFEAALNNDLSRFPESVRQRIKDKLSDPEDELFSYNWPFRYLPDNMQYAVSSAADRSIFADSHDSRYQQRAQLESHSAYRTDAGNKGDEAGRSSRVHVAVKKRAIREDKSIKKVRKDPPDAAGEGAGKRRKVEENSDPVMGTDVAKPRYPQDVGLSSQDVVAAREKGKKKDDLNEDSEMDVDVNQPDEDMDVDSSPEKAAKPMGKEEADRNAGKSGRRVACITPTWLSREELIARDKRLMKVEDERRHGRAVRRREKKRKARKTRGEPEPENDPLSDYFDTDSEDDDCRLSEDDNIVGPNPFQSLFLDDDSEKDKTNPSSPSCRDIAGSEDPSKDADAKGKFQTADGQEESESDASSPDVRIEDRPKGGSSCVGSDKDDVTGTGNGCKVRDEASTEACTSPASHERPRDAVHGAKDAAQEGTGNRRNPVPLDPPPRGLEIDTAEPWFLSSKLLMQGEWDAPARVIPRHNAASSSHGLIKIRSAELRAFADPSDTETLLNDSDIAFASWALRYHLSGYRSSNVAVFFPGIFDPIPPVEPYKHARCEEYWAKDTWLIPYNIGRNHWALAIVKAQTRRVLLFDSLASADDLNGWRPTIELRIKLLISEAQRDGKTVQFESFLSLSSWSYHQLNATKTQSNFKDCGVWVLWIVSAVLQGYDSAKLEERRIDEFREFCAKVIRTVPTSAHEKENSLDTPVPPPPAATSSGFDAEFGVRKKDPEEAYGPQAGNTTAPSKGRFLVQPVKAESSTPLPASNAALPEAEPSQLSDWATVPVHSLYLAHPVLSAGPETGSGQKSGQTWQEYFAERDKRNLRKSSKESPEAKKRRECQAKEDMRKVTVKKVYYWDKRGEEGFRVRCLLQNRDRNSYVDQYTGGRRKYDSFSRDWDLCTEFGDPDPTCATDSDFDE